MKFRWLKRIGAGLALLLFVTAAGLFLFRGVLLRYVAGEKLDEVSRRHGLTIAFRHLEMPSPASIRLEGLSVVPLHRDTLFVLDRADVYLDWASLLRGTLSVNRVEVDGVRLSFRKQGEISNYDFLFRLAGRESLPDDAEALYRAGYAERGERMLRMLFRMLPENGVLRNISVTGRRDSLETSFRLPELRLAESRFASVVHVREGDGQGTWRIQGALNGGTHSLEAGIAAAEQGRRVRLPYILPHYHALVEFDSLAFSLRETWASSSRQTLEGRAAITGLEVHHARLSPDTIVLDRGKLAYRLHLEQDALELDSTSTVVCNRLDFHPYLRAERQGRWHFTAGIHKPWFPAQDLFASLPAGLFHHVQGIRAEGELGYNLHLDVDFNNLDSLAFSSDLRGRRFRIASLGASGLDRMNDEFEYTAYENDIPVRTFSIGPSNPSFRPLARISPLLRMAIMQSEDGSFYTHQGFYPGAIQEALAYDLKVGRFARGGSSITMQLVKNVFLNRHKNIARKLEEALMVWLIEGQHLTSKDRMYEVYLNLVEWGPCVYGACEASRFYFGKEPSDLTVNEAIFLASLIPRPKQFRSFFNADGTLRDSLEGYFRLLAERLAVKGLLTEEQAAAVSPSIEVKGAAREWILRPDTLRAGPDSLSVSLK